MALQEYMRLSQGSALRWMEPFFNNPTAIAASEGFVVTVTPIGISVSAFAVFVALGLLAMMKWTRYGRNWRACADDPIAAALLGVNFRALLMTTFVLACGLAGLAGTIVTFYYGGVGFAGGIVFGLKALIAAIAGGIGSIPGAFLGAILVGGAEMVWSILFPIEYRDLAIYTLLAALLIWRPEGLLGARYGLFRWRLDCHRA
jgi:branched-chain amino acid transport system permease protein